MLNPEYIVGLVDGEGSFTVYIRNPDSNKKVKRRVVVEPKFYLKLIEKDKKILYEVKKFFGCGQVSFQKDPRPNHQNCYRYEVFKRDNLANVIIPFFKGHTVRFASKQKDFQLFCKLMEYIKRNEHLEEGGLRKLYKIKQSMH